MINLIPTFKLSAVRAMLAQTYRSLRPGECVRELDEELEAHIALHTADNISRGLPPDEARREALLHLGGLQQTRERCLDAVTFRWIARRASR